MTMKEKFSKHIFLSFSGKKNLACYFIVILIFVLDRISKIQVIDNQLNNTQIYINDFINFDLIWNTGVGFGFLSTTTSLVYNIITYNH